MKITATAAIMMAAGGALFAEVPTGERSVSVCMERGSGFGPGLQARATASQIFAGIGVRIDWHVGLESCPLHSIKISLGQNTPKSERPGALAYALPYEGTHIVVYYDRICVNQKSLVPTVLAHVLVHEITHILEGISRHSETGVMKAHWDDDDMSRMAWKPLKFAQEDIDLIYLGLAGRAAHSTLALNTVNSRVAAQ